MTLATDIALSKPDVFESRRIRLTSPLLHIGSAMSRLNPFEYVQTTRRVYLPDQEALAKGLLQRGRLPDYIAAIGDREDITEILEQSFGDEWWNARDTQSNPIFPNHVVSQKWTEQRITDLRPMIRNGFGQLYVPGSSIKGAIRTAIAYYLLKHADRFRVPQPQRVSAIEQKLREKLRGGQLNPFKQKFLDDDLLMDRFFADFDLTYQGRAVRCRQGPNTDMMRAVHVSDSDPLVERDVKLKSGKTRKDNLAVVAEVVVSSRFPDYKAKYRASIYAEMVRNVSTEFTLSLNREVLSWFRHQQGMQIPFQSVDDILQICQEFAQEQWDFEHDYWQTIKNNPNAQGHNLDFTYIKQIYEPKTCPFSLRLGWGSGMNGVTVNSLLQDELRAEIRDSCGIKAPGFEAPKSRRTILSQQGEIRFVPGWVQFKPR
jgi:CRISPR-associated protein Csm5